jgi:hypothetical protein
MADETEERVFELRSSAMFPIDDQAAFAEQDKLEFISLALQTERESDDRYEAGAGESPSMQVYGSSERPFIRVSRGSEFADTLSPDYFPKTFPCCFPYGCGGPRVADRNEEGGSSNPLLRDMTLESWAKVVLQRHGGRFAQHSVFAFLIFNALARSRNRWIAQGRVKRSAFRRIDGIHQRLTPERLRKAREEMSETGKTTDEDVLALMKELSLYGGRHPLSNESRLSMRKKVRSMIVACSAQGTGWRGCQSLSQRTVHGAPVDDGGNGLLSEPLRGKRKKYGQWSQSVMKMLIVWFVVLIVFSVLCGKLSEVPDSSKVSIISHMWVRLGTPWIGAHVPTALPLPLFELPFRLEPLRLGLTTLAAFGSAGGNLFVKEEHQLALVDKVAR